MGLHEKNEEADDADRCQEDRSKVINVHQILHFQSRLQHLGSSNVTVEPSIVVRATTAAAKSPAIADGASVSVEANQDLTIWCFASPAVAITMAPRAVTMMVPPIHLADDSRRLGRRDKVGDCA